MTVSTSFFISFLCFLLHPSENKQSPQQPARVYLNCIFSQDQYRGLVVSVQWFPLNQGIILGFMCGLRSDRPKEVNMNYFGVICFNRAFTNISVTGKCSFPIKIRWRTTICVWLTMATVQCPLYDRLSWSLSVYYIYTLQIHHFHFLL